ncbi:unnamed protein product [Dicrocoelium dendriticum]|nr:unnamed protein product [Dicrocoelium dendriticum]
MQQLLQQQQLQFEKSQRQLFELFAQKLNVQSGPQAAGTRSSVDEVTTAITELVFAESNGVAFDSWFKKYKDIFRVMLAAQDDAWKVRLLLRKLGAVEHERYTNFVLPKNPRDFRFDETANSDVHFRCLGLGRPFILKIENYEASLEKVICLYSEKHGNRGSKLDVTLSPSTDNQTLSNIDLLSLATLVNSRAGNKLFIRDLQVVRCSDDCHAVKRGELEKPKCYMAVCWCPQGGLDIQYIERMRAYCNHQNSAFPTVPISYPSDSTHTWDLTKTLWQFGPITLVQRTPIRALHRRSALERVRSVHLLRLLDYRAFMCNVPLELDDYLSWSNVYPAEELFIIDLRCDAGTYVKEFIHGDLGRTRPSLASIFQCQVDILALDVVSIELDWPPRLDDPKFLP